MTGGEHGSILAPIMWSLRALIVVAAFVVLGGLPLAKPQEPHEAVLNVAGTVADVERLGVWRQAPGWHTTPDKWNEPRLFHSVFNAAYTDRLQVGRNIVSVTPTEAEVNTEPTSPAYIAKRSVAQLCRSLANDT